MFYSVVPHRCKAVMWITSCIWLMWSVFCFQWKVLRRMQSMSFGSEPRTWLASAVPLRPQDRCTSSPNTVSENSHGQHYDYHLNHQLDDDGDDDNESLVIITIIIFYYHQNLHHHHYQILFLRLVSRSCHHLYLIIIIYPLVARVVWAPQMSLQSVFSIFPCSPLPSGTFQTFRTPGLSTPWCSLPTSSSVCFVFPLSLCLARWFWPDLMNRRHDHTTAVCVSFWWSGGLRVVQLPAGCWHGLPHR